MITKRILGIGMIAAGLLVILGLFAIDLLQASQFSGVGPMQRIGIAAGVAVILAGAPLIWIGDRPA